MKVNNYCPIYILSNFSKIFKKLVTRLTNALKKHNFLPDNQYGFCLKLSTMHAMRDVTIGISTKMSKSQCIGLIS